MQNVVVKKTKISGRNQTVVPSAVRKFLKVKKGDELLWNVDVKSGRAEIILTPMPKNWGDYLSGLGKKLKNNDSVDKDKEKSKKQ